MALAHSTWSPLPSTAVQADFRRVCVCYIHFAQIFSQTVLFFVVRTLSVSRHSAAYIYDAHICLQFSAPRNIGRILVQVYIFYVWLRRSVRRMETQKKIETGTNEI